MAVTWSDTHCHLYSKSVNPESVEKILEQIENELYLAITIGTTLEDNSMIVEGIVQHANLFGTVGIHPGHVNDWNSELSDQMNIWYKENAKIMGIGEIGLDYTYTNHNKKKQQQVFEEQLALAQDLNAPVVIHAREAIEDTLAIINNFKKLNGVVFHCFTGNIKQAEAVLNQGHYISFTGVITFPKSEELRQIVKMVPLNRIMVETDSPYLAPVPFRGKTNIPSYVSYVGEQVAQIFERSNEEMSSITNQNALNFFNIPLF